MLHEITINSGNEQLIRASVDADSVSEAVRYLVEIIDIISEGCIIRVSVDEI